MIFLTLGPLTIYWYGIIIVVAMIAGIALAIYLAKKQNIKAEYILDTAFYLIIFGILGARIYDVLLYHQLYFQDPMSIFRIWEGGLAIHGGIIAGILVLIIRKNFWKMAAIIVPAIALGQAIGRWGNYFNQELFGLPTNLPWAIKIDLIHRPSAYLNNTYFHPTFLYESIGCLLICFGLVKLYAIMIKSKQDWNKLIFLSYLISYSTLRFLLEFIRIDTAPTLFHLRFPQIVSLIIIIISLGFIIYEKIKTQRRHLT